MLAMKKTQKQKPESPTLRLVYMDPAELIENPSNWRQHPQEQTAALADAIEAVGWAGACLLNERTGRLIDGHARKKIALQQGTGKIPVLVGSWSEDQEKLILVTLDPLAAMAEADATALDKLLREVSTGSEALGNLLTELAERSGVIPEELAGGGDDEEHPLDRGARCPECGHLVRG